MSLFDLLIGAAAGAAAATILGTSAVTAAVVGAIAAEIITDDELWEKINSYLCGLRDAILDWLDRYECFGAEYIKLVVTTIDTARSGIKRVLKVNAINKNDVSTKIYERTLTEKDLEELGISVDEEQILTVGELYE